VLDAVSVTPPDLGRVRVVGVARSLLFSCVYGQIIPARNSSLSAQGRSTVVPHSPVRRCPGTVHVVSCSSHRELQSALAESRCTHRRRWTVVPRSLEVLNLVSCAASTRKTARRHNWGAFAAGAAVGVATTAAVAAATRPSTTTVVTAPAAVPVGSIVPVLPGGCSSVNTGSAVIYHCSNVYYRPFYQGSSLVYQVVTYP